MVDSLDKALTFRTNSNIFCHLGQWPDPSGSISLNPTLTLSLIHKTTALVGPGCGSRYEVITTSWYTVAQKDMQLHWFPPLHNWLITMQPHTQVIESHATAYPTVQLCTPTFSQEKAIKNDVTTVYHQKSHDIVTTLYPLLHPEGRSPKTFFSNILDAHWSILLACTKLGQVYVTWQTKNKAFGYILTFQTKPNILHHYEDFLSVRLLWHNQNYQLALGEGHC